MSGRPDELVDELGDLYLVLHRENYVRDSIDLRPRVEKIAGSVAPDLIAELLSSRDWRHQIVGTYLTLCLRSREFDQELCHVLRYTHSIARSACLALCVLGVSSATPCLVDLLRSPAAQENLDDFVAVVESLTMLAPEAGLRAWVEGPPALPSCYTLEAYVHSAFLFHAAIDYWR